SLDLVPVFGTAARHRTDYLAGSDDARAGDLSAALTAPDIDAVWALRGGYGTMRTLRALGGLPPHAPRAYIGFSDNTAVHLALRAAGVVSFHGPHAGGEFPDFTRESFHRVLFEAEPAGFLSLADDAAPPAVLRSGSAEGELIGGNLS